MTEPIYEINGLPVYLKEKHFIPPNEPMYYLMTGNGLFIHKESRFFSSTSKVTRFSGLENQHNQVTLKIGRIPWDLFQQAVSFFREICAKEKGAEAIVLLYIAPDGSFAYDVPEQWADAMGLHYKLGATNEGFNRIGTIHSHGYSLAYHSQTDDRDEQYEDGIHITVGSLHTVPTYSAEFVVDGNRLTLNMNEIVAFPEQKIAFPTNWLSKFRRIKREQK